VGKPRFLTRLCPAPDPTGVPHTVIIVKRLSVGETWIIDTTGYQYGFKAILVPFQKYIKENQCQLLVEPSAYTATETKDLDYYETLPFMNTDPVQNEGRKLERNARLRFAKWVDERVTPDIIKGSEEAFKRQIVELQSNLRAYLQDRRA
jgi:hypothetical protein